MRSGEWDSWRVGEWDRDDQIIIFSPFFFKKTHSYHRIIKKLRAHDKVCIGCAWHPVEPSRIATCGWDGLIKFWD